MVICIINTDRCDVKVERTIALLASSRRLRANLGSLSYHHYPAPIPHANNPKRSVLAFETLQEQVREAEAASKTSKKANETRAAVRIAEGVDKALHELVQAALNGRDTLSVDFKAT